jgi:hypothetical protein
MLDPWIIEQIRRREQEERAHRERPVLELPLPGDHPEADERDPDERTERRRDEHVPERGVVIIGM